MRVVAQRPYYDGRHENDAAHLLQILSSLLPCVPCYCRRCREAVGRQFHHERSVVAPDEEACEEAARHHRYGDAEQIEREEHDGLLPWREEYPRYHNIYRQACRAGHERQDEHRDESRPRAFYRPCSHDGGHVASKSHDERNERLAVQPHLVHQAVHDECRACHISRILHIRDDGVEDENLRKEDDYRPHAAQYAVDCQVLQRPVGHCRGECRGQYADKLLYHHHGIFARSECDVEHHEDDEEEDGEADIPVCDDMVDEMRHLVSVFLRPYAVFRLLQRAVDEAVFRVHDGSLGVAFQFAFNDGGGFLACGGDVGCRRQRLCESRGCGVALKKFYGEVARRVAASHALFGAQFHAQGVDALLYVCAVVDVYVPLLYFPLVDGDDGPEEVLHAASRLEDGGHHGHGEQFPQTHMVDVVPAPLCLVEHVECAHHAQVHVDELCGEIQVAFKVRGVEHVQNDVGRLLYYLSPDIHLFWAVGGERVCAGKIDDVELISLKLRDALFRLYGDARVVAHPFARPRHKVEERCLPAVRISHKRHVDVVSPLLHGGGHYLVVVLARA